MSRSQNRSSVSAGPFCNPDSRDPIVGSRQSPTIDTTAPRVTVCVKPALVGPLSWGGQCTSYQYCTIVRYRRPSGKRVGQPRKNLMDVVQIYLPSCSAAVLLLKCLYRTDPLMIRNSSFGRVSIPIGQRHMGFFYEHNFFCGRMFFIA